MPERRLTINAAAPAGNARLLGRFGNVGRLHFAMASGGPSWSRIILFSRRIFALIRQLSFAKIKSFAITRRAVGSGGHYGATTKQGPGTRPTRGQLFGRQRTVLQLPLRNGLPSFLKLEAVRCGLRQPGTEGGPLGLGGIVNCPSQFGGQRYGALLSLCHIPMVVRR
jgi:hypothetical protein